MSYCHIFDYNGIFANQNILLQRITKNGENHRRECAGHYFGS